MGLAIRAMPLLWLACRATLTSGLSLGLAILVTALRFASRSHVMRSPTPSGCWPTWGCKHW